MRRLTMLFIIFTSYHQTVKSDPIFEFLTTPLFDIVSKLARSLRRVLDNIKKRFEKDFTILYENTADANNQPRASSESEAKPPPTPIESRLISAVQLAISNNRPVETHVVLTDDGYVLNIHRMTPKQLNINQTVILHHGLLGSANDWMVLGPEKSLPNLLSERGYDVWMINARGNRYSRRHYTLNVDSKEYWNFSWHEMGVFDLPAVIDYIRRLKSPSETIDYIGFSMGATSLLVLLSTKPHYNNYLRLGILLAPLAFLDNIRGPLKFLANVALNPPEELLNIIGRNQFLPHNYMPDFMARRYCNEQKIFCSHPLFFLCGGLTGSSAWDPDLLSKLIHHVPAGSSTNTILHYAQLAHSKKFHRINDVASEYQMNKVTLPIVLFSSSSDLIAPTSDVLKLYYNIQHPIAYYTVNLSHTEFIWGPYVKELVFNKVIYYLQNGVKFDILKNNDVNSELVRY